MTLRTRRVPHALTVIVLAVALLATVWRLLPAATPPIYDGICIADPYRALGGSPAPGSASKSYPAEAQSPTDEVITSESPAQAQLLMMTGTFSSPSAPFTVTIKPVQSPTAPPAGYALDGNAYQMVATTSTGTQLQPTSQNPVTVVLRGTGKSQTLTLYVDSGSGWAALKTFNVGCGFTFEAVSTTLGYFGLFYQPASSSGGGGGDQGGGFPVAVVVAVVIIVLIVAVIVLVRVNARPQKQPQPRRGRRR